ncbi:MAG: hypothetical protein J1E61_07090 [Lachnospiraceae bacterium]|nr:hypothetical protein [Lachnospiraceae bacterium]
MRKKWLSLLLVLVLGMGIVGCSADKTEERVKPDTEESGSANKKGTPKDFIKNDPAEEDGFGYEKEEYEKFRYLKPHTVKTNWKDYVLYLPGDDADHTSGNNTMEAWGTAEGVSLLLLANTDVSYDDEVDYDPFEHSLEENLEHFVNILMYESSYYDSTSKMEMTDIFEEGDGAVIYASFLREINGTYYQVFEEYYIFYDGEDYIIAAVIVEGDRTTSKTKAVLKEIESYLDYTIYYDEDALPEIPEQSGKNPDEETDGYEYTDYWKISLPDGWKRISDMSYEYAYAPNGNSVSGAIIFIDYLGEVGEGFFKTMDADELAESMGSYLAGNDTDIQLDSAKVLGELPVGYTIMFTMYDNETYSNIYMVEDGERAFMLTGIGELGDERVAEAAEYIIKHAEKK